PRRPGRATAMSRREDRGLPARPIPRGRAAANKRFQNHVSEPAAPARAPLLARRARFRNRFQTKRTVEVLPVPRPLVVDFLWIALALGIGAVALWAGRSSWRRSRAVRYALVALA